MTIPYDRTKTPQVMYNPDDSKLTDKELAKKYDPECRGLDDVFWPTSGSVIGQHPYFTREKWKNGQGDQGTFQGTDYWSWVVSAIKTDMDSPSDANPGILHGVRVDVADGKYSVIMASDGHMQALRHGEPWVGNNITGSKFIHALASELHEARVQLVANEEQFGKSNETIRNLLEALETLKKETPWPMETMTPAVKEVLELLNFRTGPIAHVYQKAGFEMKHRCEEEQSFVLHRFLGFALKHKDNWKAVAEAELQRLGAPTHNKVEVPEQDITPANDGKLILPPGA